MVSRGLVIYNKRLSVYTAIVCSFSLSLILSMLGLFWMAVVRCSITNTYKRGDRGKPDESHLRFWSESNPFKRILALGSCYEAMICCNRKGPSQSCIRVSSKKHHPTLSNAFSVSMERRQDGMVCFCAYSSRVRVFNVLSWAFKAKVKLA